MEVDDSAERMPLLQCSNYNCKHHFYHIYCQVQFVCIVVAPPAIILCFTALLNSFVDDEFVRDLWYGVVADRIKSRQDPSTSAFASKKRAVELAIISCASKSATDDCKASNFESRATRRGLNFYYRIHYFIGEYIVTFAALHKPL